MLHVCLCLSLSSSSPSPSLIPLSSVILNSFLSSPDSQTVAHGATFILFCIHGGSLPAATITWTHNNDIIVTSSRILIQQSTLGHADPPQVSSSLAIASAVRSDSGSYACVASNPLLAPSTAVTSTPATVTVRGKGERLMLNQFQANCCAIITRFFCKICYNEKLCIGIHRTW